MEANILMCGCGENRRAYGIRVEKKADGDWHRTWAFPMDPRKARREGFDKVRVKGTLPCTAEYPGCPYCGTKGIVRCQNCGMLSCWHREDSMECAWCGQQMNHISVTEKKIELSGGQF